MELSELIRDIHYTLVAGETDLEVTGIVFDSRQVSAGSVFVAVRGTGTDGHAFIGQAIRAGAVVIVAEKDPGEDPADLCWLRVSNSRSALARMASAWYDHPSRELHLVGVTGTNGKTTVATLLHRIYQPGVQCRADFHHPGPHR
jgi:UDP-N-acetylmuramoyl-L-alanyl-D-glutamate--2,6-diaminopimelate ligase